ncbi:hypothetical protein CY0110_19397 [Crocosphaera chwakensis CCY0110]|uniref:Uncharacterized protein n=1 Tax=Crocosphaera chwakensis CCY0110 TaxID=391612 RepID=A3IJL1_9CHRO|nr:hypothetical protein CY0110_19397 [Crocosphaera chwakensis CCY0110]
MVIKGLFPVFYLSRICPIYPMAVRWILS